MRVIASLLFGVLIAQSAWAVPIGDREIVLKTLAMEAGSEGVDGMAWVALTLANRALKRNTSMSSEALRRKQYSCWNDRKWSDGWLDRFYTEKQRDGAIKGLEKGLGMAVKPEYRGIMHYHTEAVKPNWSIGKVPFRKVGSHLFYNDVK